MRTLIIGVLFLLAAILFVNVDEANAGNVNQIDRDVFGNSYILDSQGRRDAKIETDSQGRQVILNRYGLVIGKLEYDQDGNNLIIYTN